MSLPLRSPWHSGPAAPSICKTGRYDVAAPKEIFSAAAGPLPYRDQAELLVILRPVLPEPYESATGKIILARAIGERPELEPSETPLYASTFPAEKGHKAATVAKFQSGFGDRCALWPFKRRLDGWRAGVVCQPLLQLSVPELVGGACKSHDPGGTVPVQEDSQPLWQSPARAQQEDQVSPS